MKKKKESITRFCFRANQKKDLVQKIVDNRLYEEEKIEDLLNASPEQLKQFHSSVNEHINQVRDQMTTDTKTHYQNIADYQKRLAINEAAYTELTTKQGRNTFIKASSKY